MPNAASQAQPAASSSAVTAKPAVKNHPPLLSDPKTVDDADRMIAWENRDIDSQQEYVDRLQTQIETATTPDQKEHWQQILAERQKILADTRREQQELVAQRKALQKKPVGDSSVASSQPPQ
jgi:hypothetical protein